MDWDRLYNSTDYWYVRWDSAFIHGREQIRANLSTAKKHRSIISKSTLTEHYCDCR